MRPRSVCRALTALFALGLLAGCGHPPFDPALPDSSRLGAPRGYRIARTVAHFHSPYSNDACDKKGLSVAGVPDSSCLGNLKRAICSSKIDLLFLTDHPSHMAEYEFSSLLLQGSTDTIVSTGDGPYYNIVGCGTGFSPKVFVGFEGRALGLGMKKHLEASVADRTTWYNEDGTNLGTLSSRLKSETDAIVVAPHSESRTLQWLQDLNPDAIEIYNYHANMDPKIRQASLGLPPFGKMGWLLTYLVDPYASLTPDLAFLHFLEVAPVYLQKWRQMIFAGYKVGGILGTDSHENILSLKANDGERVDSHRRLTRMMSVHVLSNSTDPVDVKVALRAKRYWNVFEGLGTPVGMDFSATATTDTVDVGGTLTLSGRTATLRVALPTLHRESPWGRESPIIRLRLIRLDSASAERVVASSENAAISYVMDSPGTYRAEVRIVPRHLREYMSDFPEAVDAEFPWILTNPIYLE